MFFGTNLLTLLQYFCQSFLFWFHLPFIHVPTHEAALLSDVKMLRSVLKALCPSAQKATVLKVRAGLAFMKKGWQTLPHLWVAHCHPEMDSILKNLLKTVSAASASNASLSLCSKYPKGLNKNSSILLIFASVFLQWLCTRSKMKWKPIYVPFSVTKANAFQVISVGHPQVP